MSRGEEKSGAVRRGRRSGSRQGSATIEFALLLPILLTIALLVLDFGRYAHTYIAVSNAARAAAGCGSQNPFSPATQSIWVSKVRQAAVDEMAGNSWFNEADLTVSTPVVTTETTSESGGVWRMSVEVSYPFTTVVNWNHDWTPGYNNTIILRRSVVMRSIR
ncbi:MAG: TadE/TadG family type IV pilus assembly protein [Thermomicrobiales bacterium]